MANELDVIGFNVTTPTTTFGGPGSTRGINQLRESSTQLSQLLSEKIQAFQVDQAIKQGQEDAMSGKQPKTLAPSGLNAVTNAYNQSVIKRTGEMFEQDYTAAKEGLDEALATGNTEGVKQYGQALDNMIDWYGERHPDIRMAARGLKKQLAEDVLVGKYVGAYAQLGSDTSAANTYLAEFVSNPPADLTVAQQQKAAKKMWDVRNTQSHLQSQAQAEQLALYKNSMVQGVYPSTNEINNDPVLSDLQKIELDTQARKLEAEALALQAKIVDAQKQIFVGNSAGVDSNTINKMYNMANSAQQAKTDVPPSMVEIAANMLGQTKYPVSGVEWLPVDRNIKAFDSILSTNIASGDPSRQAEAMRAIMYLDEQDASHMYHLSGKEQQFASVAKEILKPSDLPYEEALKGVHKSVYEADELEARRRRDRYDKVISGTIDKKFKEAFGERVDRKGAYPENDLAREYFRKTYEMNYIGTGSELGALDATTKQMQGWGESEYFRNGAIGFAPPEKAFQQFNLFPAMFRNQLTFAVQGLIDSNAEARKNGFLFPEITWDVEPSSAFKRGAYSEKNLVKNSFISGVPRIKVDDHQTEVHLVSGPDIFIEGASSPTWQMFYVTRYGEELPLGSLTLDPKKGSFTARPVEDFAPSYAMGLEVDALDEAERAALKAQEKVTSKLSRQTSFETMERLLSSAGEVETAEERQELNIDIMEEILEEERRNNE